MYGLKIGNILFALLITFYGISAEQSTTNEIKDTTVVNLIKELKKHKKEDKARVRLLNKIAFRMKGSNKVQAQNYAEEALKISKKIGFKRGKAVSYNTLGSIHTDHGDLDQGMEYYLKSLKIFEELGVTSQIILLQTNIATAYFDLGDPKKELIYLKKALRLSTKTKDTAALISCHHKIGNHYSVKQDVEKARSNYERAFELAVGNFEDNAFPVYEDYIHAFNPEEELDTMITILRKSLQHYQEKGKDYDAARIYYNIGFYTLNFGDFEKGLPYFDSSLVLANASENKNVAFRIHNILHLVNYDLGNHQIAYDHLMQEKLLNDEMYGERVKTKIAELETKYQTEKKDKELVLKEKRIALLNKDKEIRSSTIRGLAISIVLLIFAGVLFFIIYRNKKKSKEKEAELKLKNYSNEIEILRSNINARLDKPREDSPIEMELSTINSFLSTQLSEREFGVLIELKNGKTNKEIAESLHLSVNTIKTHLLNIYIKLDAKNRTQAVRKLMEISEQ